MKKHHPNYNKQLLINKKSYEKNKHKYVATRVKYRLDNLDKINSYFKAWRQTRRGKLITSVIRHNRRAAQITTMDGSVTRNAIENLLVNQFGLCVLCSRDIQTSFHIDHIKPLSRGGTHTLGNIQLLCPQCNLKKSNKT